MSERRYRIVVCRGPECGDRRDAAAVHAAFERALPGGGATGQRVELDWQSCFGRCSQGPNVLVREVVAAPARVGLADLPSRFGGGPRAATALYNGVDPRDAVEIVAQHVGRGVVVRRLIQGVGAGVNRIGVAPRDPVGSAPVGATSVVSAPVGSTPVGSAPSSASVVGRGRSPVGPEPVAPEVVREDVEAS